MTNIKRSIKPVFFCMLSAALSGFCIYEIIKTILSEKTLHLNFTQNAFLNVIIDTVHSFNERLKVGYLIGKETLERLKADGMKVKGRLRDKVAEALNVSPAQVGKIENIKHNAVDEVKEAVKNGDMTIATADSIAKLSEEEQAEIVTEKPVSEITTKDIKKRTEKKAKTGTNELINNKSDELAENNDNEYIAEVPLDKEVRSAAEKQDKLIKWAQSVDQDQLNYLLDSGWYNSAIWQI